MDFRKVLTGVSMKCGKKVKGRCNLILEFRLNYKNTQTLPYGKLKTKANFLWMKILILQKNQTNKKL